MLLPSSQCGTYGNNFIWIQLHCLRRYFCIYPEPVELFLPLCHKRDTSKSTTAKQLHSKGLTKKMSSENNELKSSDRTVRMCPPNKTSSSGNEILSTWHHQGFHRPLQNSGLKNRSENQQFSSTVSNPQVRKVFIFSIYLTSVILYHTSSEMLL